MRIPSVEASFHRLGQRRAHGSCRDPQLVPQPPHSLGRQSLGPVLAAALDAPGLVVDGIAGARSTDDVERQPWLPVKYGSAATDSEEWFEVFRAELNVEAINRIGMQCIFEAVFPLDYFARINATIEHLLDLYA